MSVYMHSHTNRLTLLRFPLKTDDGREVDCTVQNYFADTYQIRLQYPNLPCLHVGPQDKNIYIPLEVYMYKNIGMYLYQRVGRLSM